MDSLTKVVAWLFKSKWAQGHRRQISVGLTTATAVLAFASGPIGAVIPILASPAVQHDILATAAYFGLIGEIFKNDPTP